MGAGKTTAAINYMNSSGEKMLFVTPYLEQVDRILSSCRSFSSPERRGKSTKGNEMRKMIERGENIAATHALLSKVSSETLSAISASGYTLIIDECMNILQEPSVSSTAVIDAVNLGFAKEDVDAKRIEWVDDGREIPNMLKGVYNTISDNSVLYYGGGVLFWTLDPAIFRAFDNIIVLTYLFSASMQKWFFDINGIQFDYIGVEQHDGSYFFTEEPTPNKVLGLKDRVLVYDGEKINRIGDTKHSLSSSWYKRNKGYSKNAGVERLRRNSVNMLRNIMCGKSADFMWSTYLPYKDHIAGKDLKHNFVPFNSRATNAYSDRTCLAYLVNIYLNPFVKRYFVENGAKVDEDRYALSEMIQWIWRSAIREGKEIQIYVPSSRMRNLLTDWLEEVS